MKRRYSALAGGRYTAGFSLIEVLISFVVLAVGLLALLSFHSTSQKNIADAKIQAEAVALAEGKLQELESFLDDTDDRLSIDTTTETVTGGLADYTLTWEVEEHADPDLTSIRVAQVDVFWADRDGIAQQVSLVSDIHFIDPAAGIEEFLKLAAAVKNPGGGGNWVGEIPEGGNGEDPGDDQDPPNDPGDDVENPGDDGVVSMLPLTITGSLSGSGVELDGIELELDTSLESQNLLQGSCTPVFGQGNKIVGFSCSLLYADTLTGWTGQIELSTNKKFCQINGFSGTRTPSGTPINNADLTLSFIGLTQNQSISLTASQNC